MNEDIKKTGLTPEEDYAQNFVPAVHKIGRATMAVAFVLSLLPFAYFYFIKGYQVGWSMLFAGLAGVAPMLIDGWISEPFTYWPVLGSAGTYMAYLSGNVSGMRFPVATAVQKSVDADISTPRGQVATIVGIVTSIVANLVILLITVFTHGWHYILITKKLSDGTYLILDPSLKEGKYEEEGRKGLVRVDGDLIYADAKTIDEDCALFDNRYYMFWKKA